MKRVLAIDGGGVRGIIPASVLALWEESLEGTVPEQFDFFAGTSTGAIVAAGLATGLSAKKVKTIFEASAPEIFSRQGLTLLQKAVTFKGWAAPAYNSEVLRAHLRKSIGEITLGECPRPLSIPCVDVVTGGTRVFRSAHYSEGKADREIPVIDAVLASTAAPVFFASAQVAGSSYVDGALWANNPALVGWLDARDGSPEGESIKILSLGCGKPFWGKDVGFGSNRGLVGWGLPLISLMMAAQAEGVDGYMRRLLPKGNYLRIDPALPKGLASLDNADNLPSLAARAQEAARFAAGDLQVFLQNVSI